MNTRFPMFVPFRHVALALAATACVALAAAPAAAQSAETRYERALGREQAARKADATTAASLRAIATYYEAIVRQFPRSGYADNALWQAAGVLQLAWNQAGNRRDRDQAVKLLQWLRKEYPSSTLARQVPRQTTALNQPRVPPVRAAASRVAPPMRSAEPAPEPESAETASNSVAETTRMPAPATVLTTASAPPDNGLAPAKAVSATTGATSTSAPAASAARDAVIHLRGISHTRLPRGDRITLELSREASYSAERQGTPDRLSVVLSDADVTAALTNAAASIHSPLIQGMRLERDARGLQLVVTLAGRPRHSAFPLYAPYRLVFDFETEAPPVLVAAASSAGPASATAPPLPFPQTVSSVPEKPAPAMRVVRGPSAPVPAASTVAPVTMSVAASTAREISNDGTAPGTSADDADEDEDAPEAASTTKPAPPASTSAGGYSLARQLGLGVSRVVIDPGHGGTDPGAQANGVTEAALVLDVALRLEQLLKAQPGFEVVLTRRTHQAVALERRTAIANAETADLFLSIHANSSPRRETAGVETYFLNFASNDHAESVAARENASSAQSMRILPQLVRAITMNNKLAESRELAGIVQASLVRRLKARNKAFQDLGVKQAPFVVLIGAQMPSVLAEIAFLTNRAEASLVKQNAYKQQIAQALCDAILKYQASLKKVSTVTASAEGR